MLLICTSPMSVIKLRTTLFLVMQFLADDASYAHLLMLVFTKTLILPCDWNHSLVLPYQSELI